MTDTTTSRTPTPEAVGGQSDPHCKCCAYRVFERRASSTCTHMTMVCLHPRLTKMDCAQARHAAGVCGEGASLWRRREDALCADRKGGSNG